MTVSSVFSFTIFLFLSLASPTISDSSSDSLQTFIVHVARSHKPSLFSTHQQWGQLDPLKVEGKIVLCDYGDARNDLENKVEKEDAVKLAGGLGMILALANGYGEILTASTYLIPTTMVGEIAGNKIREYIRSDENPTATIAFRGTNVGSSAGAVYKVKVNAPENVDVRVSPKKLVFNAVNQALSYNIRFTSFKWASLKKSSASFGSIEWSDGVHKVRSPIAVRWSEGPKASI
ncbi:subtilisin-like protease [Tripterygium wilfordii]|uniref:Subtilisin-like protease n=1 Tax=Tripterygium wilfordii TaxID=458696 RepID=A0A7J7CEJ7_TRIWF|nr:subtilisin-like protease [Tripterygium wilfordii]